RGRMQESARAPLAPTASTLICRARVVGRSEGLKQTSGAYARDRIQDLLAFILMGTPGLLRFRGTSEGHGGSVCYEAATDQRSRLLARTRWRGAPHRRTVGRCRRQTDDARHRAFLWGLGQVRWRAPHDRTVNRIASCHATCGTTSTEPAWLEEYT